MATQKHLLRVLLASLPFLLATQQQQQQQDPVTDIEGSLSDVDSAKVTWNSASSSASSSVSTNSIEIQASPSHDHTDDDTQGTGSGKNQTDTTSHSYPPKKTGTRKLAGYFPSYNADDRPLSNIRYDLYDELSFFVATTQDNFTIGLGGLNQTYWDSLSYDFVSRCKNASVLPIYTLGGWTGSRFFSNLTSTDENREKYAQAAIDFAHKYGFEGIDIDWEYPAIQGIGCNIVNDDDVHYYQLFLQKIKQLWPEGKLSTAVSIAGIRASDYSALSAANVTILAQSVDTLKIMAYDVHGSWTNTTGPASPIRATCSYPDNQLSVETAIEVYLRQGFSPSQLYLGIPGYGKSWTLASPHLQPRAVGNYTTYYYQNFTGIPAGGEFDDTPGVDVCGQATGWGGSWLVSELVSNGFLSPDEKTSGNGFVRYYDECSMTPFIVRNTTFISYDDTYSTVRKVEYAKSQNLSGIFFFDTLGPIDATVAAARDALLD